MKECTENDWQKTTVLRFFYDVMNVMYMTCSKDKFNQTYASRKTCV